MVNTFNFAATPKIIFGSGRLNILPELISHYGKSVLLVTGKSSFIQSDHWERLLQQFESTKIKWVNFIIEREPTPELIDVCVAKFEGQEIDAVMAIGGGSVIDAGKAISAMFKLEGSVLDYLEGVGTRQPSGDKLPFIAVPTTSGTGAEATKNAVISEIGEQGFKKSIRHDKYVPDIALVDPELILNCPKVITAQSGMDAFTQLLESYVSTNANSMTDSLAVEGIRKIRDGLEIAVINGSDLQARERMAYASMISGITLANAGLGTVHGFASSIGGFFDIPHGLVCARMMGPVNRLTVDKLKSQDPDGIGLLKYARIGKLFSKDKNKSDENYIELLLDIIDQWTDEFGLRKLAEFGVEESDFSKIISATGNKYNPIALEEQELEEVLKLSL
jgi:alcohol dehydrogenase class IV